MPTVRRSALVERSAEHMFDLVNDVSAYPRRFAWCDGAQMIEQSDTHMVARLDLGVGSLRTWFTTENTLDRPHSIEMQLKDGPFKRLTGRWEFVRLADDACKVNLSMDFEPNSRFLAPALSLGLQGLADRMVNDFVKVAESAQP